MTGVTSGLKAAPGTIRGDFGSGRQMNLVHASDNAEAAKREIAIFFDKNGTCKYEPAIRRWLTSVEERE